MTNTNALQVTRLLQNPLGEPAPAGTRGDIVRVNDGLATIYLTPREFDSVTDAELRYLLARGATRPTSLATRRTARAQSSAAPSGCWHRCGRWAPPESAGCSAPAAHHEPACTDCSPNLRARRRVPGRTSTRRRRVRAAAGPPAETRQRLRVAGRGVGVDRSAARGVRERPGRVARGRRACIAFTTGRAGTRTAQRSARRVGPRARGGLRPG
jgi:hypothetical protein